MERAKERKPYKTLIRQASDEFVVHKSRFIGHGCPVESEEEALAFLGQMRARYADASHNCYAYILGQNSGIMRYSDDGEPGGTAGMPIIEVLRNRGVTNCVVVVTRYFGGVLLGAGGLVRAYTKGAVCALSAAGVGVMHPTKHLLLDVPYPMLAKTEHMLKGQPVQVVEKTFADMVTLTLLCRECDCDALAWQITTASDGRMEPIEVDESYMPWPDDDGSCE